MQKKLIILIIPILLLMGCTCSEEKEKVAYLEYKNDLENKESYSEEETIDFNIYFNIEKKSEELVNYSLMINNPKINMNNVKALLIHNFINEDVFPSVGIFDDPVTLKINTDDSIVLNGNIQTINDIINTEFKLYIEYIDDNNNVNKIYYKLNRG